MPIRPEHIVTLNNKAFVQFPGLLNLAHESGLTSIQTELVQIPSAENGNCAIIKAIARFDAHDITRCWTAYGDASPANTKGPIQHALLRMAETRAIGRALRMACNIGETLLEELDDDNGAARTHPTSPAAAAPRVAVQPAPSPPVGRSEAPATGVKCVIDDCKIMLTEMQRNKSQSEANLDLCAVHLAKMKAGISD